MLGIIRSTLWSRSSSSSSSSAIAFAAITAAFWMGHDEPSRYGSRPAAGVDDRLSPDEIA